MIDILISRIKDFSSKNKHRERLVYYLAYTIFFAISLMIVFHWFLWYGKTFLSVGDATKQHYPAFVYLGTYLRQIITDLFSTGTLSIPQWDFRIGYGSDIITTLSYYALGDPFSLFSALVPQKYAEVSYSALVLLRLYISGTAFSVYCRRFHLNKFAVLCGTMVYVFSGYTLAVSSRHPFFLNTLIFLPLLLFGAEKILNKEKPYFFICITAISCLSNYYFFCMIVVLTAIYIFIRGYYQNTDSKIRHLLILIRDFCFFGGIGVLIAAPIFLPSLLAVMNLSRLAVENTPRFFYDLNYYLTLPAAFIGYFPPGHWTPLSYSSISLVALILLFCKKNKYKELKIAFIVLTGMLLLPATGALMNGFSFSSNRWIFGYCFLIALITVVILPEMFKIEKRVFIILICFSIVYSIFIFIVPNMSLIARGGIFVLFSLTIFVIFLCNKAVIWKFKLGNKTKKMAIISFILFGITVNSIGSYSSMGGNNIEECVDYGQAYKYAENISANTISELKDTTFYRFESYTEEPNTAMLSNEQGVGFYFSISQSGADQFIDEMCLNTICYYNFRNLDQRVLLNTISGVKYSAIQEGKEAYRPYGFDQKVTTSQGEKNNIKIYETEHVLPFGYTYSSLMFREEYEKLSPLQKQQAILQCAVVEENLKLEEKKPLFQDNSISYQVKCEKGADFQEGRITIKKSKAKIHLLFDGMSDAETYLYFKNLNSPDIDTAELAKDERAKITVACGEVSKTQTYLSSNAQYHMGKKDMLFQLGYSENPPKEIVITFAKKGVYNFDDLQIVGLSMKGFPEQVSGLKEDTLQNVEFSTNNIKGSIQLEESKMLCFSMPYSEGWTVYVNGEKDILHKVNTMFSGILLKPGSYSIELKYRTPGLTAGFVCAGIGILLILIIYSWRRIYHEKVSSKKM